jgi:mannosyltransferase OCH1-like enzyme
MSFESNLILQQQYKNFFKLDNELLNVSKLKNEIPKIVFQIYIQFDLREPIILQDVHDEYDKVSNENVRRLDLPMLWHDGKQTVQSACENEGWKYILIDNSFMNVFLKCFYSEFIESFWNLPYSIERVDILKYLLLHRYGGLYMDMDFLVNKPFFSYISNLQAPLMVLSSSNMDNIITNSLIVSVPKIDMFFRLSKQALLNNLPFWAISTHLQVMLATGPLAFTKIIKNEQLPYVILPRDLFFPSNPLFEDAEDELEYRKYIEKERKKTKSFLMPIKGATWNSLDSQMLNMFNRHKVLLIFVSSFLFLFQIIKNSMGLNNSKSFIAVVSFIAIVCVISYVSKV